MSKRYKETLELAWSVETFVLYGNKGTKIYKESRVNHVPGMIRVENGKETPLDVHDYLVFEVTGAVDEKKLTEGVCYHHGVLITRSENGVVIACHHPQVFHNGMLSKIVDLGYVKRTWFEKSKERMEYPMYVNPNSWQLLFNLWSLTTQTLHKGMHKAYKKAKRKETV